MTGYRLVRDYGDDTTELPVIVRGQCLSCGHTDWGRAAVWFKCWPCEATWR